MPSSPDSIECAKTALNSVRVSSLLNAVQLSIGLMIALISLFSFSGKNERNVMRWLRRPMINGKRWKGPSQFRFLLVATSIVILLTIVEVVLRLIGIGCLPVWLYNATYVIAVFVFMYTALGLLKILGSMVKDWKAKERTDGLLIIDPTNFTIVERPLIVDKDESPDDSESTDNDPLNDGSID